MGYTVQSGMRGTHLAIPNASRISRVSWILDLDTDQLGRSGSKIQSVQGRVRKEGMYGDIYSKKG